MIQRKVLPPRSNRGKRPQQTQQQKAKQDVLYNQIFEAANISVRPLSRENFFKKTQLSQMQSEHRQYFVINKGCFPYSRGYHYFFDLTSFPRVDGSVSYAQDSKNAFHSTYSQQNILIKDDLKVGELFNRKIFGLPTTEIVQVPRTKDKNICHIYLFQNEDRKFQVDRMLYELKQILINFEKLESTEVIKNFSCLRKDVDLIVLLSDCVSEDEKKKILSKKLKILEEKKQNMKQFLLSQDKNFYYHSLNQKLHDQIQQISLLLSYQCILRQISDAEFLRQEVLNTNQQVESSKLAKLFLYYQAQKICLTQNTLKTMATKISPQLFKKKENDGAYEISIPFLFFSLSNINIMAVSQRILALRLIYQNQASFYIFKMFWKRVLGRDLTVNKEIKPISKNDYDKLMSQTMTQLNQWKKQKQKENKKDEFIYPTIDNLINWSVFDSECKTTDLFSRQKQEQINAREFICLVLFYRLYLCISQIYEFILINQNLSVLIANEYYSKAHNFIVQCIGSARFGIMDEVLKKLSECIIRPDFEVNFKLKWIYNEDYGVAYFIKTGIQSEWETEKQDNENEHNDNQEIFDNNQKKVKSN